MAEIPSKHKPQDFEGLLNNLQDWELSFKDKNKKLKPSLHGKEMLDVPVQTSRTYGVAQTSDLSRVSGKQKVEKIPSEYTGPAKQYDYLKGYDSLTRLSSGFPSDEISVDANSEKELGNEFFKKKKFNDAINCYSRSIALLPTAVAYANRAMAYIKIKRFQEAENDCTEALNLDDRYIKAYSRRSTARKELLKFKESLDDAEFALRLEPQNQEIKKQFAETKSLFQKETLTKVSGALKETKSEMDKKPTVQKLSSVSTSSSRIIPENLANDVNEVNNENIPRETFEEIKNSNMRIDRHDAALGTAESFKPKKQWNGKQELMVSVQELAANATSIARTEAAKNIVPPSSAYEFEVSWRRFSGDCSLQVGLLKVISPTALPGIFKNALSAPLLIDIIRCISTFFMEDVTLAVDYLQNLTEVPRFDMIIMSLSSTYKADLFKFWDEVFCNATPDHAKILYNLRLRYGLKAIAV